MVSFCAYLKRMYAIHQHRCAFLVVVLVVCCPLNAVLAFPLVLQSNEGHQSLSGHLSYLEDPNRDFFVRDVLSPPLDEKFLQASFEGINFGFTSSAYWLKFSVLNPNSISVPWLLEIAYPMLDSIELYRGGDGFDSVIKTGDQRPFSERQRRDRNFIFSFETKPLEKEIFLIRIETSSSMDLPISIWFEKAFQIKTHEEQFFLGLFFGSLFIMAVYNLFLYASLRVAAYLHYVLFITMSGLLLFSLCGLAYKYLWPNSVWLANNSIPILIFACNIFCITFMREFLQVDKHLPRFDRLLKAHVFLNALCVSIGHFFSYSHTIKLATSLALVTAILSFAGGIRLSLTNRQAQFYLLAWGILIVGIIVYGLKSFGVLPPLKLTEYSMNVGMLAEVVLLSFGLADWINTIKKERIEAKRKTIAAKQQAYETQLVLTESYERFVPQKFLSLLGKKTILDVQLGDHIQKRMTILFSDIRSFTRMSEQMSPADNFRFINSYLKRMEPAVVQYGGITDKFIGDAVMGLFEEANDAVDAALAMLSALRKYNMDRKKTGYDPIRIGIGINTGELMLGTIGGTDRMDGTVIGDAVNLASRIEELTKKYQTPLIITDHTYNSLTDLSCYSLRPLDEIQVKGKSEKVLAWEVISAENEELVVW